MKCCPDTTRLLLNAASAIQLAGALFKFDRVNSVTKKQIEIDVYLDQIEPSYYN